MNTGLSLSDAILIASGVASLATIIIMFVKLTWWLGEQFSKVRKLIFSMHKENSQRLTRLEMWANRKGFQPALDGEFTNGSGNSEEIH